MTMRITMPDIISDLKNIARLTELTKYRSRVVAHAVKLLEFSASTYRYYVTDLRTATTTGTNNTATANSFLGNPRYCVVDAVTGTMVKSRRNYVPIGTATRQQKEKIMATTTKTPAKKFRYYITDMHQGNIVGTDKRDVAANLAQSEDYFVVDTETGEWMQTDEALEPIKEIKG